MKNGHKQFTDDLERAQKEYSRGLITLIEAMDFLKRRCDQEHVSWDRDFEKHIAYCLLRTK